MSGAGAGPYVTTSQSRRASEAGSRPATDMYKHPVK